MRRLAGILALSMTTTLAVPAEASVLVTVRQVGADVVISGSGSLDLTGLEFIGDGSSFGHTWPARAGLLIGQVNIAGLDSDQYRGAFGPASFGPGAFSFSDSHLGDVIGVINAFPGVTPAVIFVPRNYVSGSALSGSDTYLNTTIAGIGFTPGSYTFSWGNRFSPETFTIDVAGGVPEPATWGLMIVGLGAVGAAMRRRRPVAAVRPA